MSAPWFYIRFAGAAYAGHLYTRAGADPIDLDEAIEEAEAQWPGEAFELWGAGGEYASEAFTKDFE